MLIDKSIIDKCKENDSKAQKELYEKYSSQMLGICIRYLKEMKAAEDAMQEGFIKILTKIHQFKNIGSFEGWMKRIMINTALMQLRIRKKEITHTGFDEVNETKIEKENSDEKIVNEKDIKSLVTNTEFTQKEIFDAISELPQGFRTVFNLYALEEYKHKEVAKMLGISTGTSKSQLLRARRKIQEKLYKLALEKRRFNEK